MTDPYIRIVLQNGQRIHFRKPVEYLMDMINLRLDWWIIEFQHGTIIIPVSSVLFISILEQK